MTSSSICSFISVSLSQFKSFLMLLRHHSCPLSVQRATNRPIRPVPHDQIKPEHMQASCQMGSVSWRGSRWESPEAYVCSSREYGSERLLMHCRRLKLRLSYERTRVNGLLSACASVTLMPWRSLVLKLFYWRLQILKHIGMNVNEKKK